jgi:hypothetical protein
MPAEQPDDFEGGQEIKSNWWKPVNVGDRIKGTLMGKRFQKSNMPGFQDQWVYELKKSNGNIWNVGIPLSKTGTWQRLNSCQLGEIVGVLFEKEGEKPKNGFHAAKLLMTKTFGMDPDYKAFEGDSEAEAPEVNF